MRHLLLLTFLSVTLFACKKDELVNVTSFAPELAGKWRMVYVKDDATNGITTKPPAIFGNVDITFTITTSVSGVMSGYTPTNTLTGDYMLGRNGTILIQAVSTTKVMETSWGLLFLDNIMHATEFRIDTDGKLHIKASTNKTLTFIRI